MTGDQSETPTPRREFIGQLAASAIVLAGTACAAPAVSSPGAARAPTPAPQPTPPPAPPPENDAPIVAPTSWDNSWVDRLTAKHKAVFEQPEIDLGAVTGSAVRYLNGLRDALGVGEGGAQVVLVIRHQAIPLVFNDAMWEKYAIGEERKLKDGNGAWQLRNPIGAPRPPRAGGGGGGGGGNAAASNVWRPQGNLTWMTSHGHILLACNVALNNYASIIARRVKSTVRTIHEELMANLIPGTIPQPNGIYATHRAQEAGCTYIRCP